MKVLSGNFIKSFHHKIINIHPSLLPKYKGLNTYNRVLKNNDKFSGCTVALNPPVAVLVESCLILSTGSKLNSSTSLKFSIILDTSTLIVSPSSLKSFGVEKIVSTD